MIDIGANIGTTSIYAVHLFGAARALAFEPAPTNTRLLRQNALANGVCDRVQVYDVALSDVDGDVALEFVDRQLW